MALPLGGVWPKLAMAYWRNWKWHQGGVDGRAPVAFTQQLPAMNQECACCESRQFFDTSQWNNVCHNQQLCVSLVDCRGQRTFFMPSHRCKKHFAMNRGSAEHDACYNAIVVSFICLCVNWQCIGGLLHCLECFSYFSLSCILFLRPRICMCPPQAKESITCHAGTAT